MGRIGDKPVLDWDMRLWKHISLKSIQRFFDVFLTLEKGEGFEWEPISLSRFLQGPHS